MDLVDNPTTQPPRLIFSNPIFKLSVIWSTILILYVSYFFLVDLILLPIVKDRLPDFGLIIGSVIYIYLAVPVSPLLNLDQRLLSIGFTEIQVVVSIYFLAIIIGVSLGVLFGTFKKKIIPIIILVSTLVVAFLAYQIVVEDIFSDSIKQTSEKISINTDITKVPVNDGGNLIGESPDGKNEAGLNTDTIKSEYKLISTNKFSPDGSFAVTEEWLGDHNEITIKDQNEAVIVDDLIQTNKKGIGYGTKFRCQCGTNFKGWVDGNNFVITILNGYGETYEYLVDARTGKVNEASLRRVE